MKILVIGHSGQVAQSIAEKSASSSHHINTIGRSELDITDLTTVERNIIETRPGVIVNAAAYTNVDLAETETSLAFRVNADGAKNVANVASKFGIPLIHLSTDYVFDGESNLPYNESSATNPIGVYGRSKLFGETFIRDLHSSHLILRTAWVYSSFANNFVKTMLRLAETKDQVTVVMDQFGNPTFAEDIATAILRIVDRLEDASEMPAWGTYHLVGKGTTSWADFAREIFRVSQNYGGPFADVIDIPSSDYPTSVSRPLNSQLSTQKFSNEFGFELPEWKLSLKACVERILQSQSTGAQK